MDSPCQNIKLIVFVILFCCSTNVFAQLPYPSEKQGPPTAKQIIEADEYLKFEVKYSFFKLAWLELEAVRDTVVNGDTLSYLRSIIRTNSRVPFMDEDIDYYSSLFYVNTNNQPVTSNYWKDNVDAGRYREDDYFFDRELNQVRYKEEDDSRDTLDLVEPATAGQEIFFHSRLFAGSDQQFRLPVYITKKLGYITMDNPSKIEMRNYAPFKDKVRTYKSEGSTENIDGPFGFSGNFRAWYLADDLRVPLEARVKVMFGNAIVRLIEYKREKL